MRLATADASSTRLHHLRWVAVSVVLGAALGWIAAVPLALLGAGNVVLWAASAIWIAKQRAGHIRKWIRLAALGFAVGTSFMWFDYTGSEPFLAHLPKLLLFGVGSAACAVPSGGLIHARFAWQMRRRTIARQRAER